jgi:acetyltransferase
MFNYAISVAYQPIPQGKRVAIVTNAGGPGVLATDRAIHEGLTLARFSEKTTDILKKSLPHTANLNNPVDLIGDAKKDRYSAAVSSILGDDGVDGALVILTPQSMTDIRSIAEELCSITRRYPKPLYTSFMGEADVSEGVGILQRHHIPHFPLPEDMCQAFSRACLFAELRDRDPGQPTLYDDLDTDSTDQILAAAREEGVKQLSLDQCFRLLDAYRIPPLPYALAGSEAEAAALAVRLGFPVVLKVVSEDVTHKSDVGGVVLGLDSAEKVRRGYQGILESVHSSVAGARVEAVLVQKMAGDGEEVIIGIKQDPSFGPVVLVGIGGIYVEILRDFVVRVAPFSRGEARAMVQSLKLFPLLSGARGREPMDVESLLTCIERVGQLARQRPEIAELDINPLLVRTQGRGVVVADARVVVKDSLKGGCDENNHS